GPEDMRQTLRDARARGVVIGAHPGYPDRAGFGRHEQFISPADGRKMIIEQVGVLKTLGAELGVPIRFLKPHGALYNQAQRQKGIARGVVAAAAELGIPLLGQPGTVLELLAAEQGVPYIAEGFPDRRYHADGSLVPRSEPDAVLHDRDEMEAQLLRLVA